MAPEFPVDPEWLSLSRFDRCRFFRSEDVQCTSPLLGSGTSEGGRARGRENVVVTRVLPRTQEHRPGRGSEQGRLPTPIALLPLWCCALRSSTSALTVEAPMDQKPPPGYRAGMGRGFGQQGFNPDGIAGMGLVPPTHSEFSSEFEGHGRGRGRGRGGSGGGGPPKPRVMKDGDWPCPKEECGNVNFSCGLQ